MRSPNSLAALCVHALAESIDARTMIAIANELIPNYDVYARTGFRQSMVIPSRDMAQQIVSDIVAQDRMLDLISALITIQESGHMGRTYSIPRLRTLVQELFEQGYIYDTENGVFVENPQVRKSRNWGTLTPGREYTMAFLRLDIVKNSQLVRSNSDSVIRKAYAQLRDLVVNATEKRNGRVWQWEGDGGLCAFFIADKHQRAALAALEIIHELDIYNKVACSLSTPLKVRIAVHGGPCEYSDNMETVTKNETLKRLREMEEDHTQPQTVTISSVVKVMLDDIVSEEFLPLNHSSEGKYYNYALKWEQ